MRSLAALVLTLGLVLLAALTGCGGGGARAEQTGFASSTAPDASPPTATASSPTGTSTGTQDAGTGGDTGAAMQTLLLGGGSGGSTGSEDASADAAPSCTNPDDQEGCPCTTGQTQKCYVGDPSMAGVGVCTWGTQTCAASGELAVWGACTGYGVPTPAACDGIDHLCNGDPNASCACTTGTSQSCYTGPLGTIDVGTCTGGTQTCAAGTWGSCAGEVTPTAEDCSDNLDHDCNGLAGCADPVCLNTTPCLAQAQAACAGGTTQPCYTGPEGTVGVGTCKAGVQSCVNGAWGACSGEVVPTAEVCTDDLDHSCNGQAGCADATCASTSTCQSQEALCSEGGAVYVMDVSYTGQLDLSDDKVSLCSGDAAGDGVSCGPTLGQGGTFNTNCAGTYQICARVVTTAGCTVAEGCVTVVVPTNNATVSMPPFPGFAPVENACLEASYPSGALSTSLDVTGTTTTGIAVNRPNVAIDIDVEVWGGSGGGSGSGGGGF